MNEGPFKPKLTLERDRRKSSIKSTNPAMSTVMRNRLVEKRHPFNRLLMSDGYAKLGWVEGVDLGLTVKPIDADTLYKEPHQVPDRIDYGAERRKSITVDRLSAHVIHRESGQEGWLERVAGRCGDVRKYSAAVAKTSLALDSK